MNRERTLKLVMVLAGLLFVAAAYPLATSLLDWRHSDEIVPMFLSVYVTLGIFLLIAARNPSAYRGLIAFTAWSSLAHAFVMVIQAVENPAGIPELLGMSAVLVVIGVPLIVLIPRKRSVEPAPSPTVA
jgi:FtsH-binding integral membrane protein